MGVTMNINKAFSILFLFSVSVLLSFGSMIYGWGIQPKNIWAIIGFGVLGQTFVQIFFTAAKDDK